MARLFVTPIDLGQLELQNARVQNLGSNPSSPVEGQIYYNSSSHAVLFYNGSSWITIGRLDQLSAPTGDVSMNSQKLTNLATPASGTDAANKTYVDTAINGLSWKTAVRAATTTNGTLATAYENGDVIDGVTLATGDRILLKNQTTGADNGIYVVAASGAPARATDADSGAELVNAAVFVQEGTTNADTAWVVTTNAAITVGSTTITFAQFGAGTSYSAGAGLNLTGTTFRLADGDYGDISISSSGAAINVDNDAITYAKIQNIAAGVILGRASGAGSGDMTELTASQAKTILAVAQADVTGLTTADSPQLTAINVGHATDSTLARTSAGVLNIEGKDIYMVGGADALVADGGTGASDAAGAKTNLGFMTRYAANYGDGSTTAFTITHNLATLDVIVMVHRVSDGVVVDTDIVKATTNTVTITHAVAPATNAYRVVVIG